MSSQANAPLLVVAMPSEMRHILDVADRADRQPMGPWVRWSLTLDGRPLTLVLSGIGMVNAGASLSRALCDLTPVLVINFGCAGAHRADMHPGDVVIGTRYVHHRAVTVLPTGEERYSGTAISPEDSSHFVDAFEADSTLLATARAAAVDWSIEAWPEAKPDQLPRVHSGPITSADAWTQATELLERIHADHGTLCEDMEAAALAQVASMHGIPFLAVKDISNNEFHAITTYGDAGGPSLETVMNEVGRRAFELVRRILEHHSK